LISTKQYRCHIANTRSHPLNEGGLPPYTTHLDIRRTTLLRAVVDAGLRPGPMRQKIPRSAFSNTPDHEPHGPFKPLVLSTRRVLLTLGLHQRRVNISGTPSKTGKFTVILPIPDNHPLHTTSSSQLHLLIKNFRRTVPLPLTKGQQLITEKFSTDWPSLYKKSLELPLRPKIRAFTLRFLNRTLPIWGNCLHCNHTNSFNHLFLACAHTVPICMTAVQRILSPPPNSAQILSALPTLWATWKTHCAITLSNISLESIPPLLSSYSSEQICIHPPTK